MALVWKDQSSILSERIFRMVFSLEFMVLCGGRRVGGEGETTVDQTDIRGWRESACWGIFLEFVSPTTRGPLPFWVGVVLGDDRFPWQPRGSW